MRHEFGSELHIEMNFEGASKKKAAKWLPFSGKGTAYLLAFRELSAATGFVFAVLFALNHT